MAASIPRIIRFPIYVQSEKEGIFVPEISAKALTFTLIRPGSHVHPDQSLWPGGWYMLICLFYTMDYMVGKRVGSASPKSHGFPKWKLGACSCLGGR